MASPVVKKPRTSGGAAAASTTVVPVSSLAGLHELGGRTHVSLSAVLVQLPESVRSVSVKGRGDTAEQKQVLDLVIADRTTAAQVTLWGKVVEDDYSQLQVAFDAREEGELPRIELVDVEVVVPTKSLRPYRKLQSTNRTEIRIHAAASLEHMPAAHLTVSSFRDLCVATAPYVVNLVGIVSEVGDIRESGRSGQPVRDFKLVDNAGASLSLIAFGASTEDAALAK